MLLGELRQGLLEAELVVARGPRIDCISVDLGAGLGAVRGLGHIGDDMAGDAVEPGRERGSGPSVAGEGLPGTGERLGGCILGLRVGESGSGHPEHRAVVAAEELAERITVAVAGTVNKVPAVIHLLSS